MTVYEALSLLVYISAFLLMLGLIYEERDPSTTISWTLLLLLLPGIGLIAYLLVGRDWRRIASTDPAKAAAESAGAAAIRPIYDAWLAEAADAMAASPEFTRRIASAIQRQCGTCVLPVTGLDIYHTGAEKFARLLDDIEAAGESIHLEYFIWENDELTARICDALKRAIGRGVEVRILYDWVGSFPFSKKQLDALKRAGAMVHADAKHWAKLNYRNHRKIAVFDGRTGYTGGMNMGREYTDGGERYTSLRDTHCRFGGPLVADLQRMFVERWYRVTGEDLFGARYFPVLGIASDVPKTWAQLAHSGAESEYQAVRNAFLLAISAATQRLRVQSPYFVPDEIIGQALTAQSLAGIDLRFMMTGVPDKRVAWSAAFSYIDDLVRAGGRLFQYDAGFFHAKTLTVDGELGVIGTTNFDIRSFALHDELSIFFYDRAVAEELDRAFDVDERECHEVTAEVLRGFSAWTRLKNAIARLMSRLL